ncbi:hypothetical protein GALL_515790 [mine drainage metagenome]|uniref:DUF218 domain-containing protein n=1 Tax=mine drainage metagenome TaxID=410659 RepID=A0A1J5P5N4_9ZZZZ
MFLYTSKILEFFIHPIIWILGLSVAALLVKKPVIKKRLLLASVVLLFIFTNPFLMSKFSALWDIKPVPEKKSETYSCAIVLGGFSSEGNHGEGFFNTSADRFIQGLKLISTGQVAHILITGGNGELIPDSFTESNWVKTQLKLFKVPDSCILIENRSRNTIENAAFTKPILQKAGLQPPYLLVTSAFRMRRSLGIFKATGISVIPYPCNYLPGTGANTSIGDVVPDGSLLGTWDYYIKEVIGTLVNKFR